MKSLIIFALLLMTPVVAEAGPTITWGTGYPTVDANKWVVGGGTFNADGGTIVGIILQTTAVQGGAVKSGTCSWDTGTNTFIGHVAGLTPGDCDVLARITTLKDLQTHNATTTTVRVTVPGP